MPEIGGFVKGHFTAACGDGSCRIFHFEDFKDNQLKWAIMRNDGHPFRIAVIQAMALRRYKGREAASAFSPARAVLLDLDT